MYVIATAGHVDHGKTTLIRALTGMEADRWAEEKRRGMTIDLGYAWTTLASGRQVAFVDVPGHQRFITNMLAGVGPVPAVLFVVAADEGWSAQSAEHLAALNALGVRHGVLAISRADLGDAELAEAEARDYLAGSPLATMEAVAVSPVTGVGIDRLRGALDRLTGALPDRVDGPTRLWIDRVFTIRGAGTVVTGTLSSGSMHLDDRLEVRPSGTIVRIKGLQSTKVATSDIAAVARVAVNLRGVKITEVRRGDALTAVGGWADVTIVDVRLTRTEPLPRKTKDEPRPGGNRIEPLPRELMLHVGSAAVAVRTRRLGDDTARLVLVSPLPLHVGDRGLLRDPGAGRVVAGLVVLDPMPPALRRRGAARQRAAELATAGDRPDLAGEVRRRGAVRRTDLVAAGVPADDAEQLPSVVVAGGWLIDDDRWRSWHEQLEAAVGSWEAAHPLLPVMPRQSAAAAVGIPDDAMVDVIARDLPSLRLEGSGVCRRDATPTLPPEVERELGALAERLAAAPFDAPDATELAAAGLSERHLALAVRDGRLVRVAAGIYLRPEAADEAVSRLSALEQPFTLSQARIALDTTRRIAVPLMELLDRTRRTIRVDSDRRAVRL
jgi:selenocysteine-specific elongation factor